MLFAEFPPNGLVQFEGRSLNLTFELSKRVSQRLTTRIMKIFLVEVLGYSGVSFVESDDVFDTFERFRRLSDTQIDRK